MKCNAEKRKSDKLSVEASGVAVNELVSNDVERQDVCTVASTYTRKLHFTSAVGVKSYAKI